MSTNEYASNAKGNTGVSLGATALGLSAWQLLTNGGLGNLLGGGVNEKMMALSVENAQLKSQLYTDQQMGPVKIEQARQAEQIVGLRTEMALREQITDGKIAQATLTLGNSMTAMQAALSYVQRTLDGISSTYVPAPKVTPLPQPAPVPPPYWPPYPPPPVVTITPPTVSQGTTGGATGGTDVASNGTNGD